MFGVDTFLVNFGHAEWKCFCWSVTFHNCREVICIANLATKWKLYVFLPLSTSHSLSEWDLFSCRTIHGWCTTILVNFSSVGRKQFIEVWLHNCREVHLATKWKLSLPLYAPLHILWERLLLFATCGPQWTQANSSVCLLESSFNFRWFAIYHQKWSHLRQIAFQTHLAHLRDSGVCWFRKHMQFWKPFST